MFRMQAFDCAGYTASRWIPALSDFSRPELTAFLDDAKQQRWRRIQPSARLSLCFTTLYL